jgi:nicotinate-nucleotide adenylyltransferase
MRLPSRTARIGILGGTFDPIHIGHIDTALAAQQALDLHPMIVMPARIPPHRQHGPSASTFHRFAMATLAVSGLDDVVVSDDELRSDGPSYTALTLERVAAEGVSPAQIFFVTGADAFVEIETWYRFPAVLELAHFVVVSRPGTPASQLADRLPQLRRRMVVPSARLRQGTRGHASDPLPDHPSVFLIDAPTTDVSSTEVRRRLRAGERISGLVPAPVEAHIRRHRLYLETTTADHV